MVLLPEKFTSSLKMIMQKSSKDQILGIFRLRTSSPKNEGKGTDSLAAGLRGGRGWYFPVLVDG